MAADDTLTIVATTMAVVLNKKDFIVFISFVWVSKASVLVAACFSFWHAGNGLPHEFCSAAHHVLQLQVAYEHVTR